MDDFARARHYLKIYDFGYRYCLEDPFLTIYEYSLMKAYSIIASMHHLAGRLEQSMADCENIRLCLEAGDRRRAQNGIGYRPSSEMRLN